MHYLITSTSLAALSGTFLAALKWTGEENMSLAPFYLWCGLLLGLASLVLILDTVSIFTDERHAPSDLRGTVSHLVFAGFSLAAMHGAGLWALSNWDPLLLGFGEAAPVTFLISLSPLYLICLFSRATSDGHRDGVNLFAIQAAVFPLCATVHPELEGLLPSFLASTAFLLFALFADLALRKFYLAPRGQQGGAQNSHAQGLSGNVPVTPRPRHHDASDYSAS